jgi:hypothetical protein
MAGPSTPQSPAQCQAAPARANLTEARPAELLATEGHSLSAEVEDFPEMPLSGSGSAAGALSSSGPAGQGMPVPLASAARKQELEPRRAGFLASSCLQHGASSVGSRGQKRSARDCPHAEGH